MGIKNSKMDAATQPTEQNMEKAFQYMFQNQNQQFTLQSLSPHILVICRILNDDRSFQKREDGFYVSRLLLKCVHHQEFEKSIKRMVEVLIKEVKAILSAKVIALISRERFIKSLHLTNFIIFFTDQNLIQNINLLNVRTDLGQTTKEIVNEFAKQNREINQFVFQSYSNEQLLDLSKLLRLVIILMIDLHLKLITRSDITLNIIDQLNQSCFVLYSKLLFSSRQQIGKRQKTQNSKSLVKMGAYFLGLGIEQKIASIYQLGVLLLGSLVQTHLKAIQQVKALPSHLFKSLPIINHNGMVNWIVCNILSLLQYKIQNNKCFSKLNINRIPSLKLLEALFKAITVPTQQITFMLEEICIQTKPFQIERVYVSSIATLYSKIEEANSDIIKRFSQGNDITYNVKAMNKQLKVKPQDIRTELESDQESVKREIISLIAKYIVQVVFHKKDMFYEYSDKALWNHILSQMELSQSELRQGRNGSEIKEMDQ